MIYHLLLIVWSIRIRSVLRIPALSLHKYKLFIGLDSEHWLPLSLTNFTHSLTQDLEVEFQARFWSWSLGIILLLMFGCGYEVHSWSRFWFGLDKIFKFKFCQNGDVWLRFWSWCKVEILKMFDQDLCLNLWYDLKKLLWQDELNPRVRCAFGNVCFCDVNIKSSHSSASWAVL